MAERSWARDLLANPLPDRGVELTWLGQSGLVLRATGGALLVDPFLSPSKDRLIDPPDRPEAFAGVDAVLITHEHIDHLDREACRAISVGSPNTAFVVPRPIVDQLTELGISGDRVRGVQPEERIDVGPAAVTAVPACHAVHVSDGYSFGRKQSCGDVRFLGYVIEAGGLTLYHAGDTINFDGLAERLRSARIDFALLPMNGRRPEREAKDIAGNLEADEAVDLAAAAGARAAIPMHYDMIAGNLGDVGRFSGYAAEAHPELAVVSPGRFRPFTVA